MEGILSSEYGSTGYGMYRWIYRSYSTSNSLVYAHNLFQRDGSTIPNANGTCRQINYKPNDPGSGPGKCDTYNSNGTVTTMIGNIIMHGQLMVLMKIHRTFLYVDQKILI